MNRLLAGAAIASTAVLGAGLLHSTADAAPTVYRPATLAYYANVDAEGDLGSHYGATHVKTADNFFYEVTFTATITHCAAVVQAGKAGGSDPIKIATSRMINLGNHTFATQFADPDGAPIAEPFMMTVTCTR